MKNWFAVDKEGLAKILARRGKEFAVYELGRNGWDEPGVTTVSVTLEYRGRNRAALVVEDDSPAGFRDLTHAFPLFAESPKKAPPGAARALQSGREAGAGPARGSDPPHDPRRRPV